MTEARPCTKAQQVLRNTASASVDFRSITPGGQNQQQLADSCRCSERSVRRMHCRAIQKSTGFGNVLIVQAQGKLQWRWIRSPSARSWSSTIGPGDVARRDASVMKQGRKPPWQGQIEGPGCLILVTAVAGCTQILKSSAPPNGGRWIQDEAACQSPAASAIILAAFAGTRHDLLTDRLCNGCHTYSTGNSANGGSDCRANAAQPMRSPCAHQTVSGHRKASNSALSSSVMLSETFSPKA